MVRTPEKFTRRAEDWAMSALCVLVMRVGCICDDVRIGLTGMSSLPLRTTVVEDALRGQPLNVDTIASAAEHAAHSTDPPGDLNATPDYKRHLVRVLCRRVLHEAVGVG